MLTFYRTPAFFFFLKKKQHCPNWTQVILIFRSHPYNSIDINLFFSCFFFFKHINTLTEIESHFSGSVSSCLFSVYFKGLYFKDIFQSLHPNMKRVELVKSFIIHLRVVLLTNTGNVLLSCPQCILLVRVRKTKANSSQGSWKNMPDIISESQYIRI